MYAEMAAKSALATTGSTPSLSAPSHCPSFPGSMAAFTTPAYVLIDFVAGLPEMLAQPHSPAAVRAAARQSLLRTRADRGPPASLLG